jgi:predicted Ser/Thr protein kinase
MQEGQRFGPFVIEKALGSGAMGAVYRARYTKTGVRMALKVIAVGLSANSTSLARFEREASILKQLSHPNIVRFYGAGRSQKTPYYAMEYIEGESLDHVMQRRGRLTWEELVTLGQQLCSALQHAHEKGIIHRDLKPSNLMVLPDGTVKLTDFGIAKDTDVTALTAANCTVGTAAYMSPEQCRGERDLNHKSDLYSLGVLFYELLTGRKPFHAETPMEMFLQHLQGEFERPSRLVLDTPVWLDTLICQLLEKKPEHRPRDAAMVSQALGEVAEKVAAQRSAGVDKVRTRAADRRRGAAPIDETDREVARTIREGAARKRIKRKTTPFYQRVWFQVIAIVALLATVGAIIYNAVRVNPDALYAEAKKHLESQNEDDWEKANEPMSTFLTKCRNDPREAEVRRWSDQRDYAYEERTLYKRRGSMLHGSADDQSEKLAFAALDAEKTGDLVSAREQWGKLEVLPEARQSLKLLAQKRRVPALKAVETLEEHVRDALRRRFDQQIEPSSEVERRAVDALDQQEKKDFGAARKTWLDLARELKAPEQPPAEPPEPALAKWPDLKQKYELELKAWLWGLLAAKKAFDLKEQGAEKSEKDR